MAASLFLVQRWARLGLWLAALFVSVFGVLVIAYLAHLFARRKTKRAPDQPRDRS